MQHPQPASNEPDHAKGDSPGRSESASAYPSPDPSGLEHRWLCFRVGWWSKPFGRGMNKAIFTVTVALLMLSFITIPPAPRYSEYDADSSLSAILSYAHQNGLQYGTDVLFTYGPLGFLCFWLFSPYLAGLRMVIDVVLGLAVALGLCRVAWRLPPVWRCLLVGLFFWMGGNAWPRTDLVINTGLFCWGMLCFVESGRPLAWSLVAFIGLGVFAALAKTSMLVLAGISIVLIACDVLTRGHRRLAVGALFGFAGGFLAGWLIAGQSLWHFADFLKNSSAMIQGYNQAAGMEGADLLRRKGWLLGLLLPVMIMIRTMTAFDAHDKCVRWRRVWLSLWMMFFAFTIWKHGWVRVDGVHVVMFLGFMPVLALSLEVLSHGSSPGRGVARVLALVCCLLASYTLQTFFFPALPQSLAHPFRASGDHLRCLLRPGEYHGKMIQVIEARRRETQLPRVREMVGRARVDVFGQHGVSALFNDLNYRPRPVFQSYAACNVRLMSLNEQFFRSEARPAFVLFCLAPVDKRMPALEDAWVLRQLLINYVPVAADGFFLLLKTNASDPPRLTLLKEGEVEPGQAIDLKSYGDASLWLEIELKPNWTGRLRQLLYRSSLVRLGAWRATGRELILRRRAPASMLAAGFIASPLLRDNEDVLNLYADGEVTRPSAYSVELLPQDKRYWERAVRYRVYRIENRLGRNINAELASRLRPTVLQAKTGNQPTTSTGATAGRGTKSLSSPAYLNAQPLAAP